MKRAFCALAFSAFLSAQPVPEAAQMEFLRAASVQRSREMSQGITGSVHATLSDGKLTHDAHIQSVDIYKTSFQTMMGTELNFKDSYKFNVAGYRLAKMLGIGHMVPVSVERSWKGSAAAYSWWVDDTLMMEGERLKKKITPPKPLHWNNQMFIVRVFDQLIYNTDRNVGNLVIDKNWNLHMIDHTRAFRLQKDLREPANLARCERGLLAKLKQLNQADLKREMAGYLTEAEIDGLLARRDKIVAFFDSKGESVLYTMTPEPQPAK
jgi:hypothetical protein